MTPEGEAARAAWARLLKVDRLEALQVIAAPASYLGPPGWIGILGLDGTVTATVPSADLRQVVVAALHGLSATDAVRPEIVRPLLPATRSVLGPASLFYPPHRLAIERIDEGTTAPRVSRDELAALIGSAEDDDVEESGLVHVVGPVFGSRTPDGDLAAASGYRLWPNGVAHLSVLTDPARRRVGYGRRAAAAAMRHATGEGLLPQWRARPHASQALALSLGLIEHGAQLSFEPLDPTGADR